MPTVEGRLACALGPIRTSAMRSDDDILAAGYTLLEMMVVLAMMSAFYGMVALNLKALDRPLDNSAKQVVGFFKQVRARAISTTQAYEVYPVDQSTIAARYASNCEAATFTEDSELSYELQPGAYLGDTGWSLCFSPRGLSDDSLEVTIQAEAGQRIVEVFLGGAVREKEVP